MTVKRAKNLDDQSIEAIVRVLDGWSGKLSWELLIAAIALRTRCTYTRQALHRHERIRMAFQLRKEALSALLDKPRRPLEKLSRVEISAVLERSERLAVENARLKRENEQLLSQFVTWAYNAHTRGLTEELLNRPLPPVDRDITRTTAKHREKKTKPLPQ